MADPRCRMRCDRATGPLRGFTMVEMLLVVAIVVILLLISAPLMDNVRYTARHAGCSSNLRQITAAMLTYATDFNGFYPIGDTSGRSVYVPTRHASYQVPQNESFNYFGGNYFDGPYEDYRNVTIKHELFVCPQGIGEVPWGSPARYVHKDFNYPVDSEGKHLTHSNSRALYALYPGKSIRHIFETWDGFYEGQEEQQARTKLRVGQPFQFKTGGSSWHVYTNAPIVSDIVWAGGAQASGSVVTNHQRGGEKVDYIHFFIAPMYTWRYNATGEANYAFEDGSVRQWTDCTRSGVVNDMVWINRGTSGVGNDGQRIPAEWGLAR